ncbi:MAG: hypothetical protein ABIY51_11620 [Ferruginibacter sp.]
MRLILTSLKKTSFLFLLCFACKQVGAQQQYDSVLTELTSKYPQEKIYMQLDKSFYNPGETIWFKTYLTSNGLPSFISKTVYAELIDERGAILQRKTMPVLQGGAASNFELPDTNQLSKLYIRAYTSWMLNFDSTLLSIKPVTIISARNAALKNNTHISTYSLSLFPEGGDLVENIESRVAFKTNDQDGKPFTITGIIADPQGKTLGSFQSSHNGMGNFNISVKAGEKYKLVWKDPSGLQHETAIPNSKRNGATLAAAMQNGSITYTIKRPDNATDDFKEFVLFAQVNEQTIYAARINLKVKNIATASISTDSLPDGIMQITLFNKMQVPVAERLVFINNGSYSFPTDLHLVEKKIEPRGKNILQVDVGGRLKSNLSVAVTDAGLDAIEGPRENIFSQLLLTSDLKGYVYDPAYYFLSDEDSVKQQLDLVMMTNGWRRYNWESLLAGKRPIIKNIPENYLSIQGYIYGLTGTQLTDKMLTGILQSTANMGNSYLSIPVNKDGTFNLNGVYFFDTVKLYYQFNSDKNKSLTTRASFSFKNSFIKSPTMNLQTLAGLNFSVKPTDDILSKNFRQLEQYAAWVKNKKIKLLETVTVKSKVKTNEEKLEKEYVSGMFESGNSRSFAVEDDPFAVSSFSILDYLRNKVAGLEITTDGPDGGTISRRGSATDVFLNETNTDISMLQSTPMSDVALIKVFDPPFFGSAGSGAGGAVAVYTKKGKMNNANVKGLNVATLQGYSAIKEFYIPDYETNSAPDQADYRTTLYWMPFLLMNAKNKRVTIPFYNNNNGKKIRVVIEGLNEAGQLTREEKVFE